MTSAAVAWRWNDVDATTTTDGTRLSHRRADAQLFVSNGRLHGGGGYSSAQPQTRRDLARVGAIVRLREQGRYLVHAAGVVDPVGRGWLLSGNSGAGKSTLAYALSRAGWAILGDDGVLIQVDDAGMTAHQWKDPLNVSSHLASEFPELRGHMARARAGDWRQRIPMDAAPARMAPVAGLIMVERSDEHSVERLGPLEALGALVRQSPLVMIDDAYSRAHLDALRRAVMVPCFRLRHTPVELHTVARVIGGMLDA